MLGGRYGDDVHLYRAISQESPEEMAAKVAPIERTDTGAFSSRLDPMDIEIWNLQFQDSKYKCGDKVGGRDRIDHWNRPDQAKARAGAPGTRKIAKRYHANQYTYAGTAAKDGCLLACGELPLGCADLSLR